MPSKALADQQALQDIRVKYLGKKGEVTALLKGLGKLSPEERPRLAPSLMLFVKH